MHSRQITSAMSTTLRDQSRYQHHRDSSLKITSHRVNFDPYARNFTDRRKMIIDVDAQAEREIAKILPVAKSHEIHCEKCFMIHSDARDCD